MSSPARRLTPGTWRCDQLILMTGLQDAWDAVHAVTPPGWYVGQPRSRATSSR